MKEAARLYSIQDNFSHHASSIKADAIGSAAYQVVRYTPEHRAVREHLEALDEEALAESLLK